MYEPSDIAWWFLLRAGRDGEPAIGFLKLRWLMSFAQRESLRVRGEPLFAEPRESCAFCPAFPTIREGEEDWLQHLRLPREDASLDDGSARLLRRVYEDYGALTVPLLERLAKRSADTTCIREVPLPVAPAAARLQSSQ